MTPAAECKTGDLFACIPDEDLDLGFLLGDTVSDDKRSEEFKDEKPTEGWANFRLSFLEGTEWDTVGRILASLKGWNLSLKAKGSVVLDVQLIEPYDTVEIERDGIGGIRVAPIDDDGNAIPEQEYFVAFEDIEEIGIY